MSGEQELVFIRLVWGPHPVKFPLRLQGVRMHELHLQPDAVHPFGRKGLALEGAWKQLAGPEHAGMLILDGDVLIDPADMVAMFTAIEAEPHAVHTAAVKIWPVSTGRELWTWAHWSGEPSQQLALDGITAFSFNFTYLPAALMHAAVKDGLRLWTFPLVDNKMSKTARKMGIPVRMVNGCTPKHMHY